MEINLKPYLKLLRLKDARGHFLIVLFGFILAKGFLFSLKDIILFWSMVFFFLAKKIMKDAWKEADKLLAKSKAKERLVEEINLFFTHRASAGSEGKEESEAFFTLHCDSGSRRDKSLLRPPSFRRKRR